MKFSITPEQDETPPFVSITSALLDANDMTFSYKIGDCVADPLPALLKSQRYSSPEAALTRAAVWLAAEMECASQVYQHRDEILKVVASTDKASRLRDYKRELLELQARAKQTDLSTKDKLKALSDAAMAQRLLIEEETSRVRFADYIDNLLSLKAQVGCFDFGNSITAIEDNTADFPSTYGPIRILNIGSQRLAVSPGGVKGGKTILTERGRVFVNCEVSYQNNTLSIDTGWRRNIAGFSPEEGFDDGFLAPIVLDIVQQYLTTRPSLDETLRQNGAIMESAGAWAQEVLKDRLGIWLREGATAEAQWNQQRVKVGGVAYDVTPKPGNSYDVMISSVQPIKIGKEEVRAYGSKAKVYDLGDGQFGVDWPHLSFTNRYFPPENDTTRHFREMVTTAAEQVAALDPKKLWKSDQVPTYRRVRIDHDCEAGLANLGLAEIAIKSANYLRSLPTNELLLPAGATKAGPVTLAEADLPHAQRLEIEHRLEVTRLEDRYGLSLSELEHNYFMLRTTRLDLPGCLAIMAAHLGMKPTTDFARFETDIRAIRQMYLVPTETDRLIDETRAKQLRSEFRVEIILAKYGKADATKKPRLNAKRRTKKSQAQAMAKRLERFARDTDRK